MYSKAARWDKRVLEADSTYKLGHSVSVISTQDVEKKVDERVEMKMVKLMEANARKKYELAICWKMLANIRTIILPSKFKTSQITACDGKIDPWDHTHSLVTSLLGKGAWTISSVSCSREH